MTIQEAVEWAIEYETNVRNVYADAARSAADPVGRQVLQVLADEETKHLNHLSGLLDDLKRTGQTTDRGLSTAIPSPEQIADEITKLKARMGSEGRAPRAARDLDLLEKALDVEIETGSFYKRMVEELGDKGQQVFGRFVEIEKGHRAIVQAEIDHLSETGYWFDFREFDHEEG